MSIKDLFRELLNRYEAQLGREGVDESDGLAQRARAALASEDGWREPDYIFDAENWDTTYDWRDRSELANIVATEGDFEPWRFETLYKGQPVWARNVVLTRDEYGDPDETEVHWFDSEEEARAYQPCPFPEGK